MTTMSPDGGKGQDVPAPFPTEAVSLRLKVAADRVVCCRDELSDAEHEVRELRRQRRRELRAQRRQRRHALYAKTRSLAVTTSPMVLIGVGGVAFLVAIIAMAVGTNPANALALAAAAWGGAAAIRSLRK